MLKWVEKDGFNLFFFLGFLYVFFVIANSLKPSIIKQLQR